MIWIGCALLAAAVLWGGCAPSDVTGTVTSTERLDPAAGPSRATLVFGGDLLMHPALGDSVLEHSTGRYDFARIFAPLAPYLAGADLVVANLETVLAGEEQGYSGYPRMNSPDDLAGGLRAAGFDVVSTANNHALDQGWEGVVATADALDAAGLGHVGTYRDSWERATPYLVHAGDVTVALLAYTVGLNGLPLPDGHPDAVALLAMTRVEADLARARGAGADVIVAMVHWGSEYMREPSRPQREAAAWLVRAGVDVVVGAHPHVVQPVEVVTGERDGRPVTGYVAYSLGNLVSTQTWRYTDSGMLLFVEVEKDGDGVRVAGLRYLPVYVQRTEQGGKRGYLVVPLEGDASARWSPPPTDADRRRMAEVVREQQEVLRGGPASPLEGSAPDR